jgi:hypothetical protein
MAYGRDVKLSELDSLIFQFSRRDSQALPVGERVNAAGLSILSQRFRED